MNKPSAPDQRQREMALNPTRSILVRAPAGSGKTDLLTRRFLRLLAEVDEPGQVVAITFTIAAAAEMRRRILTELEQAAAGANNDEDDDAFSMAALAAHVLVHARQRGWKLLQTPALLRISTIDAFCREIALQQPLLSGLGGGLQIHELPANLYRRAARRALESLSLVSPESADLRRSIESLLLWRDNNWQEMEDLLVAMLAARDRWMQEFLLARDFDEEALRQRLEKPFANAVREPLLLLEALLSCRADLCQEILALARFACEHNGPAQLADLAELDALPEGPYESPEALDAARASFLVLGDFLLTLDGAYRRTVNVKNGFPADRKAEKARFHALIEDLTALDGLEAALAALRDLPPVRYAEEDWLIVRSCFTLLRRAAAELHVVFAEEGAVDFSQVAQIAEGVLSSSDELPSDAAIALADGLRHLLVDEFQDTSRRQYKLLSRLASAWPDQAGRTCFAVGDPMQSIYFFRDADAELFARVQNQGLDLGGGDTLNFHFVPLEANFRTAPPLVERLNEIFASVFASGAGGVEFSPAAPARSRPAANAEPCALHLEFEPKTQPGRSAVIAPLREAARQRQIGEIVALIHARLALIEQARNQGSKLRIAVLGRARRDLAPIALALREAGIPFRAVDLEPLAAKAEVLDALTLARALMNPFDRIAWLGVLRAPWCGLSLASLHALVGGDDSALAPSPIPELAQQRTSLLTGEEKFAVERTLKTLDDARLAASIERPGSWLQSVWLKLGGPQCVDPTALANLDLLWSALDRLPNGVEDLCGPALAAALDKLTAAPDPDPDPDFGVHLMTIHKSKGLEFEIVIVPELQSAGGRGGYKMLSWMERGLSASDETGEITEFLIAPLQSKGAGRGSTKAWVDRVIRRRERQEMRRILYVAATRAREELHLFARPAYKADRDSVLTLAAPGESMLGAAWPALEAEVRARFFVWSAEQTAAAEQEAAAQPEVVDLMAAEETPASPALLRRLPSSAWCDALRAPAPALSREPAAQFYDRHEGGLTSRALGSAIHLLLEELARLRESLEWPAARAALAQSSPRAARLVRAYGLGPRLSASILEEAQRCALQASADPTGEWILSHHPGALSEASWTALVGGTLRGVRVDRVFRAAPDPGQQGDSCWWLIDFKSTLADNGLDRTALADLRRRYASQLQAYASVLRMLHGDAIEIRAGLYYPRMLAFDWWPVEFSNSKIR